jgi:nucleoside diphosphate kinase
METKIIKNLITSYFNVVRKNMKDVVPKTVMAFLINKTRNAAQKELVSSLYSGEVDIMSLVEEDQATVRKREVCKEMIGTLKKSLDFLNEVRDF